LFGYVLGAERRVHHDVTGDDRVGEQPGELGQVAGLPRPQQQPGGLDLRHRRNRSRRPVADSSGARRATLPLETVEAIESGTRLPTKQEFALLARGLELTAGRLATILRPVVEHTAGGIRKFG
jgi:hypothetical protein